MIDIIPAILTDDPAELERFLAALKNAGVTRVHVDILDNTLVPGRTVTGYEQLNGTDWGMALDVHLMVARPDAHIAKWQGVSRFIVHVEATSQFPTGVWGAIHPETPLERIPAEIAGMTFMTVHPGLQGNPFVPEVLEKIQTFRAERPEIPIMVDGGITPTTAPLCVGVGASILVSGSYVVKSNDIAGALTALRASVG